MINKQSDTIDTIKQILKDKTREQLENGIVKLVDFCIIAELVSIDYDEENSNPIPKLCDFHSGEDLFE